MKLNINGHDKDMPATTNIADLIKQLCKNPKHIIAEVNGQIVPNSTWAQTNLKEGDSIELVAFVGGG